MDLMKIAARVAAEPEAIVRIHMNVEPEVGNDLDPEALLGSEFGRVCAELGGNIENWEDYWLEIEVPASKLQEWLKQILPAIKAGQHGPEAQQIAEAYSVTGVYDQEGDDVPYE